MAYTVSYAFTARGSASQVNVTIGGREVAVNPQSARDDNGANALFIAAAREFWSAGTTAGSVVLTAS